MTKSEILDLMSADVDDVSRAAIRLAPKQVPSTLQAAADLLAASDDPRTELEERVTILKLLRFVQAAVAGAGKPLPSRSVEELSASIETLLVRDASSDVCAAAEAVLRVLHNAKVYSSGSAESKKSKITKGFSFGTVKGITFKARLEKLKDLKITRRDQSRRKQAG